MKTLITGGGVISMDAAIGDIERGDVLIEDGVIVDVAARIDLPDTGTTGTTEVIDASDRVVMPGFVDNHRHTWQTAFRGVGADWTFADYAAVIHGMLKPQYRPEDVYIGNLFGRVEALNSGVTTMLDWFHAAQTPEHADAAIAGLRAAPGRSIFCYGAGYRTDQPVDTEVRRVRALLPDDAMALGLRGPDETTMANVRADLELADELGLRASVHVDGLDGHRPITALHEHGLLRATTTYVHANGLTDEEIRLIADSGGSVSISPDVELKMGFGQPETGRMLAAGLRPTLSADDVPAAAGDLFATMRTAYAAQRGLDGGLTSRDLLAFTTVNAADACGLPTGSLSPGKAADVILLRTDDPAVFPFNNPVGTIVTAAHPGLVDTVLVAGRVVKRAGQLLGVDLPALRTRLLESRDHVAVAAGFPVDGTWHR
ncbi:cytosine/adenosine deaminase-related metal-dependent hydrolase [Kribbella aluminosa]|uniref:Cytosine/adenosine deaminase-related metal-dependent hydrolase n=1 Tax=Kribbella aluminosa TaxID=416017 RepID=A0ABS4UJY2_9ACTN|nr:amidohydrolase family protein [Kribbella aluminosa]MBP2351915.1 cytosine/adenosine deaminase-related metal-dependent hydrolase [Kribbella aluminosa]